RGMDLESRLVQKTGPGNWLEFSATEKSAAYDAVMDCSRSFLPKPDAYRIRLVGQMKDLAETATRGLLGHYSAALGISQRVPDRIRVELDAVDMPLEAAMEISSMLRHGRGQIPVHTV